MEADPRTNVAAVIDVGTNSTRLLVATILESGEVFEVARDVRVTRLGRNLLRTGAISDEGIAETAAAMREFAARARAAGARDVRAFGTAALREARNGRDAAARLARLSSVPVSVVSGDEEAELTFLGTAIGYDGRRRLVVDIGGGSTELVAGGELPAAKVSVPVGCVKVKEGYGLEGIVSERRLAAVLEEVADGFRRAVDPSLHAALREHVPPAVAVGGTATSLSAICQGLPSYDRDRVHGSRLTAGELERELERLAALSLEERRAIPSLDPRRADVIVAGAIILLAVVRAFELDGVEVSEHDILDGLFVRAFGGMMRGETGTGRH